ncbi:hypothetical protein EDB92DRAFT_1925847 [Lactarius akahatsu]|uniref:Uncharacterized protein n=1 Tax=Lactarius akahatsu TaxID=416441 RepID=A0AAD4L5B7_9AGAM|nr:hypothetical protein EDB92DRAFT_1925847 [Lactarius akahatsu]
MARSLLLVSGSHGPLSLASILGYTQLPLELHPHGPSRPSRPHLPLRHCIHKFLTSSTPPNWQLYFLESCDTHLCCSSTYT